MKIKLFTIILLLFSFCFAYSAIIENALIEQGGDPVALRLPAAEECQYRMVNRNPLVERLINNPLQFPHYAKTVSTGFSNLESDPASIFKVLQIIWGSKDTLLENTDFKQNNEIENIVESLSEEIRPFLRISLKNYFYACDLMEKWYEEKGEMKPADWKSFYFDENNKYRFLTANTESAYKWFREYSNMDNALIYKASYYLSLSASMLGSQDFLKAICNIEESFYREFETSYGKIIISGGKDNIHKENAAYLVDFGGNDKYYNNAGGTLHDYRCAVLVDIAGDDEYISEKDASQGSGLFGCGLLWDIDGNDIYESKCSIQQGAAFIGFGMLVDSSGDDYYSAEISAQGASTFGIGILYDDAGDDNFYTQDQGQGFAGPGGIGLLCNLNGNDHYISGVEDGVLLEDPSGSGQGGAFSIRSPAWNKSPSLGGGLGILLDYEGNDTYKCTIFGQGGAYFMSAGLLWDGCGNDEYTCKSVGLGASLHLAAGLLLDEKGDDNYSAEFGSLGCGGDRGPSIFIDLQGDDKYLSKGRQNIGAARKPRAIGIFADIDGNDEFFAKENKPGTILPQLTPEGRPFSVFLKLNGSEKYLDSLTINFEKHNKSGFNIYFPNKDIQLFNGTIITGNEHPTLIDLFGKPNLDFLPKICPYKWLKDQSLPENKAGNIEVELLEEKDPLLALENIHNNLEQKHSLIRAYFARRVGIYKLAEYESSLKQLLFDKDPLVRRLTVGSLSVFENNSELLENKATQDSDGLVRATAYTRLGSIDSNSSSIPNWLKIALNDPNLEARIRAVRLLKNFPEEGKESLYKMCDDENVFIRREAAKGLILLSDPKGLLILAKSLKIQTLDAEWNYGYNIVDMWLIPYSGINLSNDENRFSDTLWENCLNPKMEKLERKMPALKVFYDGFISIKIRWKSGEEISLISEYEKLKENADNNCLHDANFANFLNGKAWSMAETDSDDNWETAEFLITKSVKLDSQSAYWDTLAEILFRQNRIMDAIQKAEKALETAIDDEKDNYQKRLDRFKQVFENQR